MIGTVIAVVVVLGILAVVAYVLFELSPFAHHEERYHERGQRQQSPHLRPAIRAQKRGAIVVQWHGPARGVSFRRIERVYMQKPRQRFHQRRGGFVLGRSGSDASSYFAAALILFGDGDVSCGDVAQAQGCAGRKSGKQQIVAAHGSQYI